MPLNDPLAAVVRVPHGDPLGDAMKRIRIWLDGEKIQTTTFYTMADARGFTLKIGFLSALDADRFRRQFSDHPDKGASSRPPAPAERIGLSR
jgi:hypothetical protein